MDLSGKRVAIYADNVYQEMELWYPLYRLQEAGAEVVVVAAKAGATYTSKLGYPVVSGKAYDELSAADFDGVIVPGGFAPDHMRRHPRAVALLREFDAAGKLIAAICHGPWMLCSARIIQGKNVTSFFAIRDDLENAGGVWQDAEVVVDSHIVTSRKPDDLPAFMKACLKILSQAPGKA